MSPLCDMCEHLNECYPSGMPNEMVVTCGNFKRWKSKVTSMPASKQQTNADRIRAMTDEELADLIVNRDRCPGFVEDGLNETNRKIYGFDWRSERCDYGDECTTCWLDWLKQEATG